MSKKYFPVILIADLTEERLDGEVWSEGWWEYEAETPAELRKGVREMKRNGYVRPVVSDCQGREVRLQAALLWKK